MPQRTAQSDERVKRMLLALEGFSTPYLQVKFKQEAYQVANRKSSSTELSIRSRKPRNAFLQFPQPSNGARAIIGSRFLAQRTFEEAQALEKKYAEKKRAEQQFFENQRHEKFLLRPLGEIS